MPSFTRRSVLALAAAAGLGLAGCAASPTGTPPAAPASTGSAAATASGGMLSIGIAQIGMAAEGFEEGVDVTYEDRNAAGDQATLTSIASSFADKDLVVAIATPTAQAMVQALPDTPIFFAGVTDPEGAQLVASLEEPGGNVTGTSDFPPVAEQLKLITEVVPEAKTIGLLYSSAETNSHIHADMVKAAAPALGLEVREATVSNSSEVAQAAESLSDVDAFFVGTDNTIVSAIESVVQVAEAAKIPLVLSDPDSVVRGALAAYAVDYRAQGVQTGTMAATMLKAGGSPADVPVERAKDLELSINLGAAERMGVTLPEALVARADHTME